MCGRAYETYTDEELYFRYSSKRTTLPPRSPVYNLCPTMNSPVLRVVSGLRKFDEMRWQLVPSTEPAFATKLSTINARSEGVFQSRLYRDLVVRQRCIVPLSGFYEWKKDGQRKRPFKIYLKDEPIMSVAGIWDTWHPPHAGGTPVFFHHDHRSQQVHERDPRPDASDPWPLGRRDLAGPGDS